MARYRFGDVVKEVKINVNRDNNPYEFYVAGDHMDSEDLIIRRKGRFLTDDVGPAFTRIFHPGQVLYGSRRTYLKKVAIADFDGICANTTFVLETKDNNIFTQELLPFIMLSDRFTEWSVSHSKGSTNPYVLFSDLADFEIELPDINTQRSLAKKLTSAHNVKESYKTLQKCTDEMVKSQFIEMFGDPVTNSKGWPTKPLSEVAPESPSRHQIEGIVWNLNLDMIESNSGKVISKIYEEVNRLLSVSQFDQGNVLFSKLRPYLNKVVVPDEIGYATTELVPLRPDQELLNKNFLAHLLRGHHFVSYANAIATGTKMPRMPMNSLRSFKCILPPMELQQQFVDIAEQADKSKFSCLKSQFIEMFGQSSLDNGIIGDYLLLKAGKAMPADRISSSKADGMFPCFGGNGIRGYVDSYNYDGDYAIIGRQGALCGNVCLAQGKFYATEHAVVVTPKAIVDSTWLFFALNQMNLNQYARGVAQPGLAVNELEKLPFSVPDINKQIEFSIIAKQADKSKQIAFSRAS